MSASKGKAIDQDGDDGSFSGSYESEEDEVSRGSRYSDEGSYNTGSSGSYESRSQGSFRSGEDESYISDDDSRCSYQSGSQESFRNGSQGSFRSGDDESYTSGEGSASGYVSESHGIVKSEDDGSNISGEGSSGIYCHESQGSFRCAEDRSYNSEGTKCKYDSESQGSFRSREDGSYNSGCSYPSRSFEESQGSLRSEDGGIAAGSYGSHSFEGSQISFRSEEDARSVGSYGSQAFEGAHASGSQGSSGSRNSESQSMHSRQSQQSRNQCLASPPDSPGGESKEASLDLSKAFEPSEESYSSEEELELEEERSLSLSQAFSQGSAPSSESGSDQDSRSHGDEPSQSYSGSRSSQQSPYYYEEEGSGSYRSSSSRSGSYLSGDSQGLASFASGSVGSFASGSLRSEFTGSGSGSLKDDNKETSKSSNYDSFAHDSGQVSSSKLPEHNLHGRNEGYGDGADAQDSEMKSEEALADPQDLPSSQHEAASDTQGASFCSHRRSSRGSAAEGSYDDAGRKCEDSEIKGTSRESLNVSDFEEASSAFSQREKKKMESENKVSVDSSAFSFAHDSDVAGSVASFFSSAGLSFADETRDCVDHSIGAQKHQGYEGFLGNDGHGSLSDDQNFESFAEFSHHSDNSGQGKGSGAKDKSQVQRKAETAEVNRSDEGSFGDSQNGMLGGSNSEGSGGNRGSVGDHSEISGGSYSENSGNDCEDFPTSNHVGLEQSLTGEPSDGVGSASDGSYSRVSVEFAEGDGSRNSFGSDSSSPDGKGITARIEVMDINSSSRKAVTSPQCTDAEAQPIVGALEFAALGSASDNGSDENSLALGDDFDFDAFDAGSLGSADDLDASGLDSFASDFSEHDAEELMLELDDEELSENNVDLKAGDISQEIHPAASVGNSTDDRRGSIDCSGIANRKSKTEATTVQPAQLEETCMNDGGTPAVKKGSVVSPTGLATSVKSNIDEREEGSSVGSNADPDSQGPDNNQSERFGSLAPSEANGTFSGSELSPDYSDGKKKRGIEDRDASVDDSFATGDWSGKDHKAGRGAESPGNSEGLSDCSSDNNDRSHSHDSVGTGIREDEDFKGASPGRRKGTFAEEGETTPSSGKSGSNFDSSGSQASAGSKKAGGFQSPFSLASTADVKSEGSEGDVRTAFGEDDDGSYSSSGSQGGGETRFEGESVASGGGSFSGEGSIEEGSEGLFEAEDSFPSLVTNRTDDIQGTVEDSFPSLVSHNSAVDDEAFLEAKAEYGSESEDSLSASEIFGGGSELGGSQEEKEEDENSLSASELFESKNSGSFTGTDGSYAESYVSREEASNYSGEDGSEEESQYSRDGGSLDDEEEDFGESAEASGSFLGEGGSYDTGGDSASYDKEGESEYSGEESLEEEEGGSEGRASLDEEEGESQYSGGGPVGEEGSSAEYDESEESKYSGEDGSLDEDGSRYSREDGSEVESQYLGEGGSLDEENDYGGSADGSGSFASGDEGSYVSGEEGSFGSGSSDDEGTYASGDEEGTYASGDFDEGDSYASQSQSYTEGSYDSQEGSFDDSGSYDSQESHGEGLSYEMGASYRSQSLTKSPGSYDESALESIMEEGSEEEQSSTEDRSDGGSGSEAASIDEENDDYTASEYSDEYDEEYGDEYDNEYADDDDYDDDDYEYNDDDEIPDYSLGEDSGFFPDASVDGTMLTDGARFKDRDGHLHGISEEGENDDDDTENQEKKKKKKKKKKNRQKVNVRSEALLELVANVNDAMLELEEEENRSDYDQEANLDSSARRLLLGFEALLGILLALSDELELVSTFATKKDTIAIDALQAVLSFAPELDHVFSQLKPILQDFLYEEPDEEMDDLLYRLNSLMDLLVESTHRVGERHEWNPRAETAYVTLLEMLERDTLEVTCLDDGVEVPEYPLSGHLEEAWTETGHEEEFKTLDVTDDIWMFRQVCYEVLVSTDQWCPDTRVLMDICGIDPADMDEDRIEPDDFELAPVPDAAKQVLEKVHGDPLPRKSVMASILRRILPPRAITDTSLLDSFASIRNTIRNPRGLSATNLVAVSSVPEVFTDPESLGVDGVGKTTLAAMVAHHPDVRRFFLDGVIWIYIGQMELNYTRYTQCLRELLAQLYLEDDEQVPMFPDLIHTPGESKAKRRRREEGFMLHVRETIADFLQYRDVLIILDDICYEADLDWFDFAPIQSENPGEEFTFALLVTTRCRYLLPAADTVEIDMLDEADAIQLLIQESGENLSQTLMAESPEARSVVRECANHPLAVKSVGRWLNLKHATAGVVSSVEEIHEDVVKSMDKILKNGDQEDADMMYEILNMSLSPAINGEPTNIIKFCFSAFVVVFCDRNHISEFALIEDFPMVPMPMAELFFESLLELEENTLLKEGDLFYAQKKEAAVLIPEALSALGVLKVIATYSEPPEEEAGETPAENQGEEKYLQVMHSIQQEYGESLCRDEGSLRELTKDAEMRWNNAFAQAFLAVERDWDSEFPDAALDYALEMLPSHMIRGGMCGAAADLLSHSGFVRGRLFLLGRENATRRHIKDCEHLFKCLPDVKSSRKKKGDRKAIMNKCYFTLGKQLDMDEDENGPEDNRVKGVEVGRAHYDIGFSLADKECWEAAIEHWEKSQELLVSSIGMVEIVAAILFNVGVVYAEMSDYERSLGSLKQCLRIRGALHGEDHLLYAQTIQKIGDVFLKMSDYHEAMESYNWALDVMHIEPSLHRVDIGDIQENLGNIHYSKGEIDEALQCFQEALKSKQADLGEEHPELATIFHHIGNCLADQDSRFEAIDHFEQAIQLKEIDPDGGPERDADVLTIEGVLSSISGRQEEGLECYEKALNILVTKVPHQKEKVASLLHLIGCMYLMFGQHKKAMKLFEESLQARRKVLGYVHLDVASTLYNMAFLHQNRGRLDKALKCLEEALKIRKLRLPESEKVAITYEKIGKFAREMGKTTKAQNALEEALQIRKKVHGGTHEAVATVLQELGDLMDDNANYKDAMDKYFEALDIRQNLFGNDHVAVAETFYSMGYTLQNQDSLDQALDCFEESLNIRKVQLGLDAKEVGDTLNMMGFLQAKRGELDDALSLLWDALRIRKLQEDHVKVSETLKNIGNVHREKAEHELAIECYEECLRIRRSELGDVHEKVADALIAMGNVQSDMELAEEAMRSYREALTIRTYFFGEHDDSVGAVLQKMGSLEFQNGEYEKALSMLTEFIRIRQENDSENDGDYVNVLFMIGNIHKMQGNEEEAKKWWTDAYDVFQELGLSEGNPQVAQVMDNLLRQENIGQREEQKQQNPSFFGGIVGNIQAAIEDQMPNSGQRLGGANF